MEELSRKQLRDIQDIATLLFNLENGVRLSDLRYNPVFQKPTFGMGEIEGLIKDLFTRDKSIRLSKDILEELLIACSKKMAWRSGHGVIMKEVYNNEWLLRSTIHCYVEKHCSMKEHEIYLINDIVYQQFLVNCYKNRSVVYRLGLLFIAKRDKLISILEGAFGYRRYK